MECEVFIKRHLLKSQMFKIINNEISAHLQKQKFCLKSLILVMSTENTDY